MSPYQLCSFLRKELRAVHPRDLERATHLLVTLAVRCVEPGEFKETFIAARFDKTPLPPRVDPELWEERHVGSDWNDDAGYEEDYCRQASQCGPAESFEVTIRPSSTARPPQPEKERPNAIDSSRCTHSGPRGTRPRPTPSSAETHTCSAAEVRGRSVGWPNPSLEEICSGATGGRELPPADSARELPGQFPDPPPGVFRRKQ